MDDSATLKRGVSLIHQYTEIQKEKYQAGNKSYYNSALEAQNFVNVSAYDGVVNSYDLLNDPTITGFKLYFDFHKSTGFLADESYPNSALAYLDRIGQTNRKELLKLFISLLSRVSMDSSWVFQEILGLDEVFNAPMQGRIRNHEISIKTFETIDQKVQSLLMLYRQIIFDDYRDVYVIPENLRWFDCAIYVYDPRVFNEISSLSLNFLRTVSENNPENNFHQLFYLSKCEINMLTSGKSYYTNVSNGLTEYAGNNFDFTVKKVKLDGVFNNSINSKFTNPVFEKYFDRQFMYYDVKVGEQVDPETNLPIRKKNGEYLDRYKDELLQYVSQNAIVRDIENAYAEIDYKIKDWKQNWQTNIVDEASSMTKSLLDRATRDLTKLYLGNVHGYGFDDVAMVARGGGDAKIIRQMAMINDSTNTSFANDVRYHKSMGNIND